jgi:NAD(P)-dependent dehydrogenase (short-subunit alcohol dehydrogenase family)
MMKSLQGKIAVVAGATRGAGRGIACSLGEAGATVYCTGRSTRDNPVPRKRKGKAYEAFTLSRRPETIEETAEMVTARGGRGIALRIDHTVEDEVKALFARVRAEQKRLDILVNDIWGGDQLTEWGKPFWECSLEKGLLMLRQAVHSHLITSRYGVPLMLARKGGLIVEITDANNFGYRGQFYYDLVKMTVIRLAFAMAEELRKYKITSVAVTPGFLRSEAMLEYFGVSEANWQDAAKRNPSFIMSETPFLVGRGIAALAADKKAFQKTGKVLSSWSLMREYGFTDIDGRQPDFGDYFETENQDKQVIAIRKESRRSHSAFIEAFRLMDK